MFESKEEQLAFNESIDTSGWVRDSLGIHTDKEQVPGSRFCCIRKIFIKISVV